MNETTAPVIYRFGVKVFNVPEGMEADLHIDTTHLGDMARHACMGGVITGPMELSPGRYAKNI